MLQAIQRAIRYIEHLADATVLEQNDQTQDAVVRNIEIIGEAASRIQRVAPEWVARHPELPWIEMRAMRNKMIHEYFAVDWDVVWRTIKVDLPPLQQQIARLLMERRCGEDGTAC